MAGKPIYKELAHRVRQLEKEAVNRIKAEEKLKQRHNALKAKNKEIREVNASLRTMLKVGNEDKSELGEKVLSNIKELVAPYIDKLQPLDYEILYSRAISTILFHHLYTGCLPSTQC